MTLIAVIRTLTVLVEVFPEPVLLLRCRELGSLRTNILTRTDLLELWIHHIVRDDWLNLNQVEARLEPQHYHCSLESRSLVSEYH